MATCFEAVPVIDFSRLSRADTKGQTLNDLRRAIFDVGFLYLVNTGLEPLLKEAHEIVPALFQISQENKEKCHMRNSPSFLGYTGPRTETTAGQIDIREQFDFGTQITTECVNNGLVWRKLEGPSQYPNPDIQAFTTKYTSALGKLSTIFLHHVAECMELPVMTFDRFIGNMSRMKMVRYPPAESGAQGVGPHKDSLGLFTFLSQDQVGGLQILNKAGQWIGAPPIRGSLVVNIAQGFEAITGGLCSATTHRVESPSSTTRYSIPFFQSVKLDTSFEDLQSFAENIVAKIPATDNNKKQIVDVPSDLISPMFSTIGETQLRNRIRSHPDVGEIWYPDLFNEYITAASE